MPGLPLSGTESLMVLGALVGLGGLVGLGESLRAWGLRASTTRRLVHTGVGLFVAATPVLFGRPLPVYLLAGVFTVANATARARHWWPGIHAARPGSWGTVALPVSVVAALGMTWSIAPDRLFAFQGAYLVLALADPAASWVGERSTRSGTAPLNATVPGSLTFAGVAFGLSVLVLGGSTSWGLGAVVGAATGAALVATPVEAVSARGWDNFFVPVALVLVWVPLQEGTLRIGALGGVLLVGILFGGLAHGADALDLRGAAVGGLFAASLVGLGGTAWAVPGVVFFGLSSALTYVQDDRHAAAAAGAPRRTEAQVLANGGVAWAALAGSAVVPSGGAVLAGGYAVFVGALAAAAADTWATEVGTRFSTAPWSLRTGRRVAAGTSGAVSVTGTVAAMLGAASVAGAAVLTNGPVTGDVRGDVVLLVGAGLLGMAADSLVGAFLQAQYRADSGEWRETPPAQGAAPVRGWAPMGNNAVNFVGTTVGGGIALAGVLLVG
ncbi:DUF92 domain-containing protein [Salinibacter ruber]|uniref:DUF92 domain-containing protein n=1 Tax=Salinibacter ruber TaxID=146919 RepID=UPI00216A1AFE|nr:DUF92 domain-containing protein [Salinibacter ruber]MCS3636441.1 putative membrane protein [Salinibacter ruber]